jgi:hypothetical protein
MYSVLYLRVPLYVHSHALQVEVATESRRSLILYFAVSFFSISMTVVTVSSLVNTGRSRDCDDDTTEVDVE